MRWLAKILIRIYQLSLSPLAHSLFGPVFGCRFQPTCSQYALDAIRENGLIRGAWLAIQRILKCHPFSSAAGYDPAPRAIAKSNQIH